MRSVLVLIQLSFLLALYGCGSDDGPSCDDVCTKLLECDPEAKDCATQCPEMKELLRSSVFSALGDCVMDTDCETLNNSDDICMTKAMMEIPDEVMDGFLGKICDKLVSCDESMTKEQCVTGVKSEGGDTLQAIGMFADSIIDCVTECFSGKDCANMDDALEDCMGQCGMIFDD